MYTPEKAKHLARLLKIPKPNTQDNIKIKELAHDLGYFGYQLVKIARDDNYYDTRI